MKKQPAFNVSDKVKIIAACTVQCIETEPRLNRRRVYCVRDVLTRIGGDTWICLAGVKRIGDPAGREGWFDARCFEHISVPASEQRSGHLSIRVDDLDDPKLRAEWLRNRDR